LRAAPAFRHTLPAPLDAVSKSIAYNPCHVKVFSKGSAKNPQIFSTIRARLLYAGNAPARGAARLRPAPAPSRGASALHPPLRGERQDSALHPRFFCKKIE